MENGAVNTVTAEEDEDLNSEVFCLKRVGMNSGWLQLTDNTKITIGRGLEATYQLISERTPLMISRQHCVFKQNEDDQWTVTDTKSMNGVWINGKRIPPESPRPLKLGDTIHFGVPLADTGIEFAFILIRCLLKEIKLYLEKKREAVSLEPHISRNFKRKLTEEDVEPSTSRLKVDHQSSGGTTLSKSSSSSHTSCRHIPSHTHTETIEKESDLHSSTSRNSSSDLGYSQRLTEFISNLNEEVKDIQGQTSCSEVQPKQKKPLFVDPLPNQMPTFPVTVSSSDSKRPTQQHHKAEDNVIPRQVFEEILSAKNKELEDIKQEKEKVKAQKDEVAEVLENELQCIICSELFIEAVSLNCAHSFCLYCIGQWRGKKNECPICRQAIQFQTRCLALDNYIDGVVKNLSQETKTRRQEVIAERKDESACGPRNVQSGSQSN